MKLLLRTLLGIGILVAYLAMPIGAQTATTKLQWDQPLATGHTLADVQAYVYTLKVDTAAAAVVPATCVAGTPIKCTTPLALPSGPHTLTLTATNGFGSTSSPPLSGTPPLPAVSVTVTVTVSVP